MLDLITIGDTTLDTFLVLDDGNSSCHLFKNKNLLCMNYAEKTPITRSTQSIGGNAANVAVGARKLGLNTGIVTEIGDDITGHVVLHELEEAKVDTSLVKILHGRETRYSIVLNYKSERTILSYHAKRKYSLPHLPHVKWVYYTSLGKSFENLQDRLEKYLKEHPSVRMAMSPGSYQHKYGLEKIREFMSKTDLLFANKEEAMRLLNTKKKNIKAMLAAFHKKGVKTAVITDNEEGSYASDGKNMYHMPIYPVAPVAKTGAGDAYASGFLSAIIQNKSIPSAMQYGTANAESVIQKFGAQNGLCTRGKLASVIKKHEEIKPELLK